VEDVMSESVDLCEMGNPQEQSPLNMGLQDKFVLVLNLPKILRERSVLTPEISINPIQFTIFGTVVPSIQCPPMEVPFSGQVYNITSYSRPNYSPLNVNFVVDNKFKNYWVLWKWLSILSDPTYGLYSGTDTKDETFRKHLEDGMLTEYQANFSLLSKNEYNQTVIEFRYLNAFITSLGGINYDYNTPDIIKSSAEFQFSQLDVIYPQ
jgi:hypothetical protein